MVIKRNIRVLALILLIVISLCACSYKYYIEHQYTEQFIRLHVIANSNTLEDQALKLHVRDVIVNEMKAKFEGLDSKEEALAVTRESLAEIQNLAAEQIKKEGKDYPVQVMLGNYRFPEKTYGDVTLPAGDYQAVRVVIGEGKGRNWWCVLFPPLCFTDGVKEIKPGEKARGYKIFERDNIEFRLRFLELLGIKN